MNETAARLVELVVYPGEGHEIPPLYHVDKIATPLLLTVGEKDSIPDGGSRNNDAKAFCEALRTSA